MNFEGMSPQAVAAYKSLFEAAGELPEVISAYRSPEHNAKVGGAKNSQHTHGNAFDFNVAGMPIENRLALIEKARAAGFKGIGVYDNTLHFDVGPERAWGPSYSRDSIPEWARAALGAPVTQTASAAPTNTMRDLDGFNRLLALQAAAPRYNMQQDVNNFLVRRG